MRSFFYWGVAAVLVCSGLPSQAAGRKLLDQIVLHPSTEAVQSTGKRLVLPSGLEVWRYERHGHEPIQQHLFMIHFIGNASRAEREVPAFLDLFPEDTDLEIWSVNYPGYGGSKGEATLASFPSAALDVFDNLAMKANGSPIWVSSFSIGTLPALYLAKERPVKAVILRNPVPLKELILRDYGWASWIVSDIPTELDSIQNAGKIHAPALFLSSEKDQMVHPSLHQQIHSSYAGKSEFVVLPGAGHNDRIPTSVFSQITAELRRLVD